MLGPGMLGVRTVSSPFAVVEVEPGHDDVEELPGVPAVELVVPLDWSTTIEPPSRPSKPTVESGADSVVSVESTVITVGDSSRKPGSSPGAGPTATKAAVAAAKQVRENPESPALGEIRGIPQTFHLG